MLRPSEITRENSRFRPAIRPRERRLWTVGLHVDLGVVAPLLGCFGAFMQGHESKIDVEVPQGGRGASAADLMPATMPDP